MDIRNTSPICALANQFYNLDTVRRVLEEIDAEAKRRTPPSRRCAAQIQAITPTQSLN